MQIAQPDSPSRPSLRLPQVKKILIFYAIATATTDKAVSEVDLLQNLNSCQGQWLGPCSGSMQLCCFPLARPSFALTLEGEPSPYRVTLAM